MWFSKAQKNLDAVSYILAALLVVQMVIFFWCLNRGFDFSDEAYGYLGFANPREVQGGVTYYVLLYNYFFGWLGLSVVKVRIIRFLLLLACSAVFGLGLLAWLRRKVSLTETQAINLSLVILLGGCHVNTVGTQSLTYNLFTTFLLLLITGLFLYVFQRSQGFSKTEAAIVFVLGMLLFSLFIVKFSSAIMMAAALIVFLVVDKRNLKIIASYFLFLTLGFLALSILLFQSQFVKWITDYCNVLLAASDNTTASIFEVYKEDFNKVKDNLLFKNALWIVICATGLVVSKLVTNRMIAWIVAGIATAGTVYLIYHNLFYLGGTKYIYTIYYFYILTAVIFVIAALVFFFRDLFQKKEADRFIPAALFLLAVPFFGAVGTSNYLSLQIIWYSPVFFAAIFLLLKSFNQLVARCLLIVIVVNAAFQSVSGVIYFPYRIKDTLWQENSRLSSGVDKSVLLNWELKESVEKVQNLIHSRTEFKEGSPIFSFRSEYGFIYFLRGTLPGWGWYMDESSARNCQLLNRTKLDNLDQTIFIFPKGYKIDSVFQTCLKRRGINFPANYELLGETPFTFVGSSRPIEVFAPKQLVKFRE